MHPPCRAEKDIIFQVPKIFASRYKKGQGSGNFRPTTRLINKIGLLNIKLWEIEIYLVEVINIRRGKAEFHIICRDKINRDFR